MKGDLLRERRDVGNASSSFILEAAPAALRAGADFLSSVESLHQ